MSANHELLSFQWTPQPAAQALVDGVFAEFLAKNPRASKLAQDMLSGTATRFADWIDFIRMPKADGMRAKLEAVGYEVVARDGIDNLNASMCMHHTGGIFPQILLSDESTVCVGIKVDSVIDFAVAHKLPDDAVLLGGPYTRLRLLKAFTSGDTELWAIERNGSRDFAIAVESDQHASTYLRHREAIIRRTRDFSDAKNDYTVGGDADRAAYEHMWSILDAAIADLGVDATCELFFEGERIYWESMNRAGQIQHLRQNRLGLGWRNHDHHTYRCSRANYVRTIKTFEKLGFFCRERFYAGEEAGWGAQVLEQDVCGIVIFADVDMSVEELAGDFAHHGFQDKSDNQFSTVGLWVELHGEAIMQAGMHHLECVFDHKALKEQLETEAGIKTMDPFTQFPYLKQAFTEGEMFKIRAERVDRLVASGAITAKQGEGFKANGGLGSHIENLERNDGFKGFNQQGVSDIISRTDPRKHQTIAS